MKSRPTRTPLEELRRTDRSMTPGTLDGRVGEARLIFDGDSVVVSESDDDESPESEILFWQDHFVCSAAGKQTFTLTYLPLDHSEHLYWDTLYQRQSFWIRNSGSALVTVPDPENHIKAGDVITVEYAHVGEVAGPEVVGTNDPLILRGTSAASTCTTTPGVLPMPSGTQIGDLLMVVTYSYDVPDSRLTKISGGAGDGVWIGTADTLDGITLALGPRGCHQAICASFNNVPLKEEVITAGTDGTAEIPSVASSSTLAAVTFTGSISSGTASDAPPYTTAVNGSPSVAPIKVMYWNGTAPSPSVVSNVAPSGDPGWRTTVIPVNKLS